MSSRIRADNVKLKRAYEPHDHELHRSVSQGASAITRNRTNPLDDGQGFAMMNATAIRGHLWVMVKEIA